MLILHHCFSTCLADAFHSFLSKAGSSFPISLCLITSPFPVHCPECTRFPPFFWCIKYLWWGFDCVPLPYIMWEGERWVACLLPAEAQTSKGSWEEEGPCVLLDLWVVARGRSLDGEVAMTSVLCQTPKYLYWGHLPEMLLLPIWVQEEKLGTSCKVTFVVVILLSSCLLFIIFWLSLSLLSLLLQCSCLRIGQAENMETSDMATAKVGWKCCRPHCA